MGQGLRRSAAYADGAVDSKPTALEHAQTRPVEQAGHEPWHAFELLEHRAHLVPGQDDRQALRALA